MNDTCPHGVPYRWPEECIECEMQEVDLPQIREALELSPPQHDEAKNG